MPLFNSMLHSDDDLASSAPDIVNFIDKAIIVFSLLLLADNGGGLHSSGEEIPPIVAPVLQFPAH